MEKLLKASVRRFNNPYFLQYFLYTFVLWLKGNKNEFQKLHCHYLCREFYAEFLKLLLLAFTKVYLIIFFIIQTVKWLRFTAYYHTATLNCSCICMCVYKDKRKLKLQFDSFYAIKDSSNAYRRCHKGCLPSFCWRKKHCLTLPTNTRPYTIHVQC